MRQVKRWRYYCDHCKKVSGSKHVMEKHERGCTNNPERVCGLCRMAENKQEHINTLKAALFTDINNFQKKNGHDDTRPILIKNLRAVANNCPACILAAVRQSQDENGWYIGFDYAEEIILFWAAHNKGLKRIHVHHDIF
jgi:hypothetical protein